MTAKARKVTVKGPRGETTKDFSHAQLNITVENVATKKMAGKYVRVQMWNGQYRFACQVKTMIGLIKNMITGVTEVSTAETTLAIKDRQKLLRSSKDCV